MERSPTPVPDWPTLMQIRAPNPGILIGPKITVLTLENETTLIGCENADEPNSPNWTEKASVLLVERGSLHKGCSAGRSPGQAGRSLQAAPRLCFGERPPGRNGCGPSLVGTFFLRSHMVNAGKLFGAQQVFIELHQHAGSEAE